MIQAWFISESLYGSYYHSVLPVDIAKWTPLERETKALWTFTSLDAARVASRSLNEKRMVRRTMMGLPFSYYDGEQIRSNGL